VIDQIGIAAFGVTAVFLSQDKRPRVQRWGSVFGLIGQPFWIWTALHTQAWGILFLTPFYALSWARGYWNFWVLPRFGSGATSMEIFMEILKRGQLPTDKTFETMCFDCKTELRFQQKEGNVTYDFRDGDFVTVECPVCKKPVTCALRLGY
jgi:hypothetical protein